MNAPSQDIKDKLVSAGLGTFAATTGWAISIGAEPETPNTTITIYDAGGPGADGFFDKDTKVYRHPSFQVRVRALGYAEAMTKIESVIKALLKLGQWSTSEFDYGGVWMSSDVLSLGQDEHRRFRLVCNFRTLRQEAS